MQLRRLPLALILIVFILSLGFSDFVGFAQDETTVTLAFAALNPGESRTIEGHIICVVEYCSAFAVTIRYDPTIVNVDSVEVGPFLGDAVFEVENLIDENNGEIRLAAAALGKPELTDTTTLFMIQITANSLGETWMSIDSLQIGDLAGNAVPVRSIDGMVIVTAPPTHTPTPTRTPRPISTPTQTVTSTPAPTLAPIAEIDSTQGINMRSGPGTGYDVVSVVQRGILMTIVEQEGDWYRVLLDDGTEGWIRSDLLNVIGTPTVTPTVDS